MAARQDERKEAARRKLKRKTYDKELARLHVELVKLQEWVKYKGLKVCVVFEGRAGAGKGGTIKAITERVSPRVFRVIALPAPTEREKSQMYVQRYLPHLPAAGEVVIFDRSWYNRAGVERVMGFCTEEMARRFLQAVPLVEKAMVDSGIVLIKYWLEVSPEEQTRRLESRIDDGRKIWKLSPMDLESITRWEDYSRAKDTMFVHTDMVGKTQGRPKMSWDQLRELEKSGVVRIFSQTVSHPADLSKLSQDQIGDELLNSRKQIESELKRDCLYLAYPNGKWDKGLFPLLRRNNYWMAMTEACMPAEKSPDIHAIARYVHTKWKQAWQDCYGPLTVKK